MAFSRRPPHMQMRSAAPDQYLRPHTPFTEDMFPANNPFIPPPFAIVPRYYTSPQPLPLLTPPPMFTPYLSGSQLATYSSDAPQSNHRPVLTEMDFGPTFPANQALFSGGSNGGFSMQIDDHRNGNAPLGFDPNDVPPFEDATLKFGPTMYGVIRIKNIPYSVTKSEIIHFLGRHAPTIRPHIDGTPIHIIMERSTSKTMDCYVELRSPHDSHVQFRRHEQLIASGKHPKLGTRHVGLEVASQDELLSDLFPRAKSLVWKDGVPKVVENNDPYSAGFTGFFTLEEIVGLIRHAEFPQRSPFSAKCLQRTYECTISTLYKFPWYTPHLYTLAQRDLLWTTFIGQLRVLVEKVEENNTVGLTNELVMDFVFSGMNCPGFSERMKAMIVANAGRWGGGVTLSPLCAVWPFEVLGRKMVGDKGDNVVRFYLYLIELCVQVQLSNNNSATSLFPFPDYIDFRLSSHNRLNAVGLASTTFHFKAAAQKLSFDTCMGMEMCLMELLLKSGWDKWSYEHGIEALRLNTNTEDAKLVEMREQMLKNRADADLTTDRGMSDETMDRSATDFTADLLNLPRTPKQYHVQSYPRTPKAQVHNGSPPQSPKGTVTPEAASKNMTSIAGTRTPYQPILDNHYTGSMSAKQPAYPKYDPTSTAFEPRKRMLSDPTSFATTHDEEPIGLGFGLVAGLSHGRLNSVTLKSNSYTRSSNDDNIVGRTSASFSASSDRPRRNAAVDIRHPDGTPAKFDDYKFQTPEETREARGNVAMNDAEAEAEGGVVGYASYSLPASGSRTPRSRSGSASSASGSGGGGGSFNPTVGSSPTKSSRATPAKTPRRSIVKIASTIQEESEGPSEAEDEVVLMSGGRKRGVSKL